MEKYPKKRGKVRLGYTFEKNVKVGKIWTEIPENGKFWEKYQKKRKGGKVRLG